MQFGQPRPRRRPSLTPMIDVVFLLLVFFMLAARFGHDTQILLRPSGMGAEWSGPPRLVQIGADSLTLNGIATTLDTLPAALDPLMATPDDPIVLRAGADVPLQRVVTVMDALTAAGKPALMLVE